ncbi:MAG: hypothetical protein ACK5PQ_05090 [Alphaproteobacteria bacterium]
MKKTGFMMMMGTLALGLNGWSAANTTDTDFPPSPSNKVKKQTPIEEFPLSLEEAEEKLKEVNATLEVSTDNLKPYEDVVNSIKAEKNHYLYLLKEQRDNPSEELKDQCEASRQRLQNLLKQHQENQKNPLYGHLIMESLQVTAAKFFYEDYIRSMNEK